MVSFFRVTNKATTAIMNLTDGFQSYPSLTAFSPAFFDKKGLYFILYNLVVSIQSKP
jgi:hypothetical protein